MEKITLYSKDAKTKGKLITLPLIGDTQFSNENTIEVDEDKVDQLLALDFGIRISLTEKDELPKTDPKEMRAKLKTLSQTELEDLLTAYPEEEVKGLTKKSDVVNYLISKL